LSFEHFGNHQFVLGKPRWAVTSRGFVDWGLLPSFFPPAVASSKATMAVATGAAIDTVMLTETCPVLDRKKLHRLSGLTRWTVRRASSQIASAGCRNVKKYPYIHEIHGAASRMRR